MEAPKIPSLFGFKSKKPDRFYFEPRYYDERKEKLQERYDRISREVNKDAADKDRNAEAFKSSIRENWGNGYVRNKMGAQMNKRVIIYVVVLLVLAYLLLS